MDYNTSLPMKKVPRIPNQFPPKKTIFFPRMFRYFLLTSFPFSKDFDGFNFNLTKISKARSKASCGDSCEQYIDLKGFDGDLHMLTTMKRIKKGSGHCCLNRQKG